MTIPPELERFAEEAVAAGSLTAVLAPHARAQLLEAAGSLAQDSESAARGLRLTVDERQA